MRWWAEGNRSSRLFLLGSGGGFDGRGEEFCDLLADNRFLGGVEALLFAAALGLDDALAVDEGDVGDHEGVHDGDLQKSAAHILTDGADREVKIEFLGKILGEPVGTRIDGNAKELNAFRCVLRI